MAEKKSKKTWSDLTEGQRAGLIAAAALQIALAVGAWADLASRPAARVRGPKGRWAAIIAINFVGPALYFARGRR